jgi:hypothetical protein
MKFIFILNNLYLLDLEIENKIYNSLIKNFFFSNIFS